MSEPIKAYGDGRIWDDIQKQRINDQLNILRDKLDIDDLYGIRKETLALMDYTFPTGFTYRVNQGCSETVTGGYMEGKQ